jgi:hypothetical protein
MHFRNGLDKNMKMEFEKKQWKKHHALVLWYPFLIGIIVITISIALMYSNIAKLTAVILLCAGCYVLVSGMLFSISFLRISKSQEQKFDRSVLKIIIAHGDNIPSYAPPKSPTNIEYTVSSISRIHTTLTHIIIDGVIIRTTMRHNAFKEKSISKVRIPRNFANEDQIINLDIEKYNEIVQGLSEETEKQEQKNKKKDAESRLNQ